MTQKVLGQWQIRHGKPKTTKIRKSTTMTPVPKTTTPCDKSKVESGARDCHNRVIPNTITATTLESLKRKLEPYRNTLVLDWFEVKRLVDVVDGGDDYYWVFDTRGKGIVHSSCVGDWIPLKGTIPDRTYELIVQIWNLNNEGRAV